MKGNERRAGVSERIKQILYCRTHGKKGRRNMVRDECKQQQQQNGNALICSSDKFHCAHKISRNKHASNGNEIHFDLCSNTTTKMFMGICPCFSVYTRCMIIICVVVPVKLYVYNNIIKHCMCSAFWLIFSIEFVAHVRIIIISLFFCWLTTAHNIFFFYFTSFHDHFEYISFVVLIFKQLYV